MLRAERLVFDMSAFGITFGKMTVERIQETDSTELYTLHAKGYLKVLWMERSDETKYEVRYLNGKLISSGYKHYEKGQLKKWSRVQYNGNEYSVETHKGKSSFTEVPVFSVLKLHFFQPQNISRIFYEEESAFTNLNKRDANTIEIKGREGNRSVYHYENGKLKSMEFHISIATVYMKLSAG